jgi:hypothetical protein
MFIQHISRQRNVVQLLIDFTYSERLFYVLNSTCVTNFSVAFDPKIQSIFVTNTKSKHLRLDRIF